MARLAPPDGLPRRVRDVMEEWGLEPDGPPGQGHTALVLPVRRGGEPAVLKLAFTADETGHEALALQRWGGNGAARLLRADPRRGALLLERLHPEDLTGLWDLDACEVVAASYSRLHVPALPQLRPFTEHLDRMVEGLAALPRDARLPHRLVEQALSLHAELRTQPGAVVVHGDLHYENVLAADREPWLVIDPRPMAGDPHLEIAPMLWHRWDEVVASGDVRAAVRRRFHTLVDAAGFDEDRARDWVVVRMVFDAYWEILGPEPDRDWLTVCISVAKAVQE